MPKDMRTKTTSMEEHFWFHWGIFCLPYHPPKEVIVKGAKSQVWKTVVVGVFLEDNVTGVFWRESHRKGQQTATGTVRPGETPSD